VSASNNLMLCTVRSSDGLVHATVYVKRYAKSIIRRLRTGASIHLLTECVVGDGFFEDKDADSDLCRVTCLDCICEVYRRDWRRLVL
jgi:hypothetical protein